MPKNQPRCYCGGEMKRNGTTSKGTTRWRCKQCGASSVKHRGDITNAAVFTAFIDHLTTGTSLDTVAHRVGCSPRTLQRRFEPFWLIDVPDPTVSTPTTTTQSASKKATSNPHDTPESDTHFVV